MKLFYKQYRVLTHRKRNWNYRGPGLFFITVCTQNKIRHFGEIARNPQGIPIMNLSPIGQIAHNAWMNTFEIRPDMNLFQGAFVVMPDHFHAIIGIGRNAYNCKSRDPPFPANPAFHSYPPFPANRISNRTDAMHGVSSMHLMNEMIPINSIENSIPHHKMPRNNSSNEFGPQMHNLGSIIRGYKSAVTIAARAINPNFAWQRGYHDHVVQSEIQMKRIRAYIENNVRRWKHIRG